MLDRELKRVACTTLIPRLAAQVQCRHARRLHVLVALGDVGPHQVARALSSTSAPRRASRRLLLGFGGTIAPAHAAEDDEGRKSAFTWSVSATAGADARCCQRCRAKRSPVISPASRRQRASRRCAAFLRLSGKAPQRVMPVEWGQAAAASRAESPSMRSTASTCSRTSPTCRAGGCARAGDRRRRRPRRAGPAQAEAEGAGFRPVVTVARQDRGVGGGAGAAGLGRICNLDSDCPSWGAIQGPGRFRSRAFTPGPYPPRHDP